MIPAGFKETFIKLVMAQTFAKAELVLQYNQYNPFIQLTQHTTERLATETTFIGIILWEP
jgi:hypothetical protein